MSQPSAPKMLRRLLTAVAVLVILSPSAQLRAQDDMDGTDDTSSGTVDVDTTNPSTDDPGDLAATTLTAATPEALAPVQYTGRVRKYPAANDGSMANGALTLLLAPTGKVTGTITWSGTAVPVNVTGKYDVASGEGRLVVRDASGAVAAGALRMPFRVSKSGLVLTGGGMASSGETSGFRLSKQTANIGSSAGGSFSSGSLSLGGATLSFGGSNTYTGSSSFTNINTLTLGNGSTTLGGATTAIGATTTIGATLTTGTLSLGSNIASLGSGTLTISSGLTFTFGGNATVSINPNGAAVVTPASGSRLSLGTVTLGGSGSDAITISGSATATVVGGATVTVGATGTGTVTLTPTIGGTVTVSPAGP